MRTIAALSVLIAGILATDNYVRVENGKVVGAGAAASLPLPSLRSEGGSGAPGNVFNGEIGITDALNPNSPISIWLDDLLNPESDPYKQAVVDAMKILLTILLIALGGLGVDTFTVIVLGFRQGSIIVEYQVQFDSTLDAIDIENAVIDTINDHNLQVEGYNLDNSITSVGVAAETITAAICAECWIPVDDSYCIPDPEQLTLSCNPNGMELRLNTCIMGATDLPHLSLSDPTCDESSGAITMSDDNTQYVAFTALDACSTSMTFWQNYQGDDTITFSNYVVGQFNDDSDIISTTDRHQVNFECHYATTYDNIDASTNVTSSINEGTDSDMGQLSFGLKTYTDNTFSQEDNSGIVQVGTTLYFGVIISQVVEGIVFTTTDCVVRNSDKTLSYNILTDRCPNTRVNFQIYTNSDPQRDSFSYTVFEFRDDAAATLHLSCNIVVCIEAAEDSTCAEDPQCGNRRKKRSLNRDLKYYNVAMQLTMV